MSTSIIFHVSDHDGHSSALIAALGIKKKSISKINTSADLDYLIGDIKFIPASYRRNISDLAVERTDRGDNVIIVDLLEDIGKLYKISEVQNKQILYIDHHIHTEQIFSKNNLLSIVDPNYSAAYLTYKYFFGDPHPISIKYVSDYDTWNHDNSHSAIHFHYYLSMINTNILTSMGRWNWFKLIFSEEFNSMSTIKKTLEYGKVIEKYIINDISDKSTYNSFRFIKDNIKYIGLNSFIKSSLIIDPLFKLHKENIDVIFMFSYDAQTNSFMCSFYSLNKDIDVSKIAMMYGGGGHKNAAGCNMSYDSLMEFISNRI